MEYFPFGESWVEENTNQQRTPYLFSAKELDEETGLYYFGARYYDPRTSVWQSADPILGQYLNAKVNNGVYQSININLYRYAAQNPLRITDPDGRADCDEACEYKRDFQDPAAKAAATGREIANAAGEAVGGLGAAGVAEGITGKSNYSGKKLSWWERGLAMVGLGGVTKSLRGAKTLTSIEKEAAQSAANASRLKAQLAFEEAGILTRGGEGLTQEAITLSREISISGGRLTNPEVVRELTKDGSRIEDWGKFTTQSVELSGGQRSQIHFYQNRVTGEVNLNIDFKVKESVR